MPTFRKERISEAIRQVVSEKLTKEYPSIIPGGIVTINRVDVTKDLSLAKVFFTFFGGTLSEAEVEVRMKEVEPEFRFEISKKLNLRRTPQIRFCFDRNTEYAFKVNKLLSDI